MIDRYMLEINGFRKYANPSAQSRWNSWFFQKAVTDDKGIRYFIDIEEYDHTELVVLRNQQNLNRFLYEPEVILYGPTAGECMLRVKICDISATADVASLETYVDKLWHKLDCGYYELYNE